MISYNKMVLFLLQAVLFSGSFVAANSLGLDRRTSPDNTAVCDSVQKHCLIVPKNAHTNIGNSEQSGGTTCYCTSGAKNSPQQGNLPGNFWKNAAYSQGKGSKGGRYSQLTGCINPGSLDRLNSNDAGGQYDSSGGQGGKGNPSGSVCSGYKHYVEIMEPKGSRACIRCCDDSADCPTNKDTSGCPSVIPGNYFNCG
ncbi:hypothetical protein B0H34DRAFT_676695 [Crassisporium funariophilum]|nr:hypothetical protein B0H34DRAFT_676695 [Crassisporium funariophilum]